MTSKRTRIIRQLRELENPKKPDPARRSERSRTAILDATLELVLLNGWRELTIEGIAARAGVGKQTIYRWWPSKGAVVFDALLGEGAGLPPFGDTGDFEADLRSLLKSTVAEFGEPSFDRLMRALTAEVQEDDALARELDKHLTQPLAKACSVRIESAVAAGQVDPSVETSVLIDLAFGPILRRWLLGTGELDEEFADALTRLVLKAVRPG